MLVYNDFIMILNVVLCLYVTFFGFAVLMGTVEISRKEMMMRLLKIGTVIMFTNSASWNLYNDIIVKFFYDSMNYVIGIFSDLSDRSLNAGDSTLILNAKMDRAASNSNSTRFSFIDSVITMLLSEAATAKIFGLFFGNLFGIIYILVIYALILFFIYVMLMATLVYVINLIKIIFVLCLGPVFMCFMLFNQTSSMFKNWIGFLGGRSLEMVLMFLVLYNFVTILDTHFRTLLYYRACVEDYRNDFIVFKILKSDVSSRNLAEWVTQFFSIATLIYITKMIMEKIPEFAGGLISIGGVGVSESNRGKPLAGGGLGGAPDLMSSLAGGVASAANVAFNGTKDGEFGMGRIPGLGSLGSAAMEGGTFLARKSGVAGAVAKIADSIPGLNRISSPRAMMRNQAIDKAIGAAKADAAAKGLSGAEADRHIRGSVTNAMRQRLNGDNPGAKRLALAGLDDKTVQDRLDKKLIQDPLKDFIKAKSAEIKARNPEKIPDAKQFRAELRSSAKDWAKQNLSLGAASRATDYIDKTSKKGLAGGSSHFERDLKNLVKDQGRLKTSEAAKAFKNNPELQNKFMQSLQDNELRRQRRNEEAGKSIITAVPNLAGRAIDMFNPTTHHDRNLESAKQSFVRQVQNQQRSWTDIDNYNPLNLSNTLSHLKGGYLQGETQQANQKALRSYLSEDSEKMKNNSQNLGVKKDAAKESAEAKSKKDKEKSLKEDKKRALLQRELHKSTVQDLAKEAAKIKKLEKQGKFNEAFEEKKKLLDQAKKDLFSKDADKKKSDQPTLFEKAARLSYLQNQFGLGGKEKDAQMLILKEIDEEIKESSSKIKDEIARKTDIESQKDDIIKGNEEPKKDDIIKDSEESQNEIERLRELQLALFSPKIEDDELSKKIEEKLEKIIEDWKLEEPASLREKEINFDNYSTGSEIADNALAELSSLVASKDLPQDYKKEIAENHEEIIQSQKDNLRNLDEILVEIKDIESSQLRKKEMEEERDKNIEKAKSSIKEIIELQQTISNESSKTKSQKELEEFGEKLKNLKKDLSDELGLNTKELREIIERNDKDREYLNKFLTEKFNKELEEDNKNYTLNKELPKAKALIAEIKELQVFISQEEALKASLPKNSNKKTEEKAKIKNKNIEKKLKKPNERLKELKAKLSNKLDLKNEKLEKLVNLEERNQLIFLNKSLADKFEKDLEKIKNAQEFAKEKKLREEAKKSREIKVRNQIKKVDELIQQIEKPQEAVSGKMDAGKPKQANDLKEELVGALIVDYNTAIDSFVKAGDPKNDLIFTNLDTNDKTATALENFKSNKDLPFTDLNNFLTEKFNDYLVAAETKIDELKAIDTKIDGSKTEETSKEKFLEPEKKDAELEKVKEFVGLIATSFEVQFGSSITDALLKECDIGLKASNVLLGVPNSDPAAANPKEEAKLKIDKTQAEGRFKLAKMNLKIAQFELEKLSNDPEKNKRKIAELKAEINSFEVDKNKYEQEINKLETST
jgi:type IV secretory pathway VirB6-like protein